MRLASFEIDYWQLRSGEKSHQENPTSFMIPSLNLRLSLRLGHAAKLIFEIETEDENGSIILTGERTWVIFAERIGDSYIGILDNQPACISPDSNAYLCFGAEIPFRAEHVIEIAEPPATYINWQLKQAPERKWPRNE